MHHSIRRLSAALFCVLPLAASAGELHLLPAPDLAKLQMEDAKSVGGAYRYGIQIPVKGFRFDGRSLSKAGWTEGKRAPWTSTSASWCCPRARPWFCAVKAWTTCARSPPRA
jgi:hypothetical protein